ncbi:hypothetical protein [Tersicoccus sp. Bi-70]|uniref:hypothetical protein n=1 Tax=Tersicoccus sp. Bi-70 TaxID=1897634 RepID=UPI0009765E7D|nr:hypothetical protein [Tersicoccus sp. Bi-70]OMH34465.1 hypothetical protein BGP79_05065 [Tersicoccus sp. Bi-70]
MSKENESRLTSDGLSRNLGGEYAQEHGYGDAETYSDGSPKHVEDDRFHVHADGASTEDATTDPLDATDATDASGGENAGITTGTTGQDGESAEPNEERTEQLEQDAFGESGSGKSDPGAFTQAPG